jgi:tRNA nucleotidyltransferase (CCA-adding enzyme)
LPLVKEVCDRLKVPNDHRQLAMIVTEFHLLCHKAFELRPETILKLLKGIGALKPDNRLEEFLLSCEADARGRTGFEDRDYPMAEYLRQAREVALEADISDLVATGISGAEIGAQLSQRQTAALTEFKQNYPSD